LRRSASREEIAHRDDARLRRAETADRHATWVEPDPLSVQAVCLVMLDQLLGMPPRASCGGCAHWPGCPGLCDARVVELAHSVVSSRWRRSRVPRDDVPDPKTSRSRLEVPSVDTVVRYLIFGQRKVAGWLDPDSAEIISALGDIQSAAGYHGAVGEIGVHHGKLFILLLLLAANGEGNFAIDVFEQQHLNIDRSGCGDREKFLANVRRWAGNDRKVSIIARSSFDVRREDIVERCGSVRLASIDGGHTKECTINDLRLIESVLTEHGIIIVDDYFNSHWPDVSAGVAEYLLNRESELLPFAISPNKLYLTARANSAFYRAQLRQRFSVFKVSRMFGADVDVYQFTPEKPDFIESLKIVAKKSPAGPYLLTAKNAVRHVFRSRAL
jgi:hypothetical protein